jgi:hypothetical protein
MNRLEIFNVYLLTLIILCGSILSLHIHPDQLGSAVNESSKEIEDTCLKKKEVLLTHNLLHLNLYHNHAVAKISLPPSDAHSHNFFTTFQLLNSNRIALPPPIRS